MKRAPFTPDRDLEWMNQFAPAARAKAVTLMAALECIAHTSEHHIERDIAHDALNEVYGWRPTQHPELKPEFIDEMTNSEAEALIAQAIYNN